MSTSIPELSLELLRRRWRALLAVAVLAMAPALAATELIEVLDASDGAIVNGSPTHLGSTNVDFSVGVGTGDAHLTLPAWSSLAWLVALAVGTLVLAGAGFGRAWLNAARRAISWMLLGTLVLALAMVSFWSAATVGPAFGELAGMASLAILLACAYPIGRVVLALPAMLVNGHPLGFALRRAWAVTRGRALLTGTWFVVATIALPWAAGVVAGLLGELHTQRTGSATADAVWTGVATLLEQLALVAIVPVQTAVLVAAYLTAAQAEAARATGTQPVAPTTVDSDPASESPDIVPASRTTVTPADSDLTAGGDENPDRTGGEPTAATDDGDLISAGAFAARPSGPGTGDRAAGLPAPARWSAVVGMVTLMLLPATARTAAVLANPHRLPVGTTSQPQAGQGYGVTAMTVLGDGRTAVVEDIQIVVCGDDCGRPDVVTLPCLDGAEYTSDGPGIWGCTIEGPIDAADIDADGRLLALTQRSHDGTHAARLFWCTLAEGDPAAVPHRGQICQWGGATTPLATGSGLSMIGSMAVAGTPDGGFAAAILRPSQTKQATELVLVTCDTLDCPQRTTRVLLELEWTESWQRFGEVDVAVDPVSGALALGLYDRATGSLWLGGCPAGCPQGPTLSRVLGPPEPVDAPGLGFVTVQVAATSTGPIAVTATKPLGDAAGISSVSAFVCNDLACTWPEQSSGWNSAVVVTDSAGDGYLVGSEPFANTPQLVNLRTGEMTKLPGQGQVSAAAFGTDGRLRMVLVGESYTVVSCATDHCTIP